MIEPGKHQLEVVEKFQGLPYCLIGDSMGVGKTLSGVLLDFEERRRNPGRFRTLIVCTKGGLSVWKYHLEDQGVPSERILVIDPGDRAPFDRELLAGALNYDYYIIHYQALPLMQFFEKIQIGKNALVWDHIIADEAHFIKGRKSDRTLTLKRQKALKRTAITGTPADDKPLDIWSILNWLDKKKYSSYWRFFNTYIDYTDEYNHKTNTGYRKIQGTKNMPEYHEEVSPFYIRRTLPEVRGSMPPKTHAQMWVDLSPRQRQDYDQMKAFQVALLGKYDEELVVDWQIAVYQRLQQMTLGTVEELDWSAFNAFWERHENTPAHLLPKNVPTGPKLILGEPSPKLDVVLEKIAEAADEGESVVVLSQYKEVVRMVADRCRKEKIKAVQYHGGITSQVKRDAAVADFQSRKVPVFVGTIGAAGTSITLTAARTLMFVGRHWNPSVNLQAEDRIWRYDTQDPVQILDVLARGTVDDDKLDRLDEKARRVNSIVEVPEKYK